MTLSVRLAAPEDRDAVATLIDAMDRHYHAETAIGLAVFAVLHPGNDLSRMLFVKDLFVAKEARGRGAGTALMRFLAAYCVEHGIGRIDLEADADNSGARALYERLGAERRDQKIAYRFDAGTLARLANPISR